MPVLTDAERAQLKRFDPANMPRFARFISGPEDTADIFDPKSERRLWIYRPDWNSLGLTGFFGRKATLPGYESAEEMLMNFSKHEGNCIPGNTTKAIIRERERAKQILNSEQATIFIEQCQAMTLAFMQNMQVINRADMTIRFDSHYNESALHDDAEAVVGAMATEWGGTLVPDPISMHEQGFSPKDSLEIRQHTIQALLAKNVDIYQLDMGDLGLLRGCRLQTLAPFKEIENITTMHSVNPTPGNMGYSRPFVGILWDIAGPK